MSKIDELVQILRAARSIANKRGEVYDGWEMDSAGIVAVVTAMRPDDDEIASYDRLAIRLRHELPCECEYLPEDRCISCDVYDALKSLERRYHEILGDAGEKETK